MNAIMKILIEENTKVRKLPGPTGVGATGIAKVETVGIMGSVVALGPLGMSMTARQNNIRSK